MMARPIGSVEGVRRGGVASESDAASAEQSFEQCLSQLASSRSFVIERYYRWVMVLGLSRISLRCYLLRHAPGGKLVG